MQRSRFWTGVLENPLSLTNQRFQETSSGPGRPSRERLENSETSFRGPPTPRLISAFVAGPLQTWLQNFARVHTWWALWRRPANCCLNSSHGSAPSLAQGSRRHCPLCRWSAGPMRKQQMVSIGKGPFTRYPPCHLLTDSAARPKPSSRARLLSGVPGQTDNLRTALGLCQGCCPPERAQKSSVRWDRCLSTRKKRYTA